MSLATVAEALAKAEELRQVRHSTDEAIAAAVIVETRRSVVTELAQQAIVDALRAGRRAETLDAERRSAFEAVEEWKEQQHKQHAAEIKKQAEKEAADELWNQQRTPGTPEYEQWTTETEPGRNYKQRELQWELEEYERSQRFGHEMQRIVNEYEQDLRMRWTEELLNSELALPDGRLTTWGDATIQDHEARRVMFLKNAQRNGEGAARHAAAIKQLQSAGVPTLRQLTQAAA